MTERICPECGADSYRAAGYDELRQARDRHWAKNQQQAVEILRLQLRVAELEEWQRTRNRKIEQQRRTIVRLESKIRESGARPHDDKQPGEGDPASRFPAVSSAPPSDPEPPYPPERALREMRRNRGNGS